MAIELGELQSTHTPYLDNNNEKSGFRPDSKIPNTSVTKELTIELESIRSETLTMKAKAQLHI